MKIREIKSVHEWTADMERVTRSLAPMVCEIYGWKMAGNKVAARTKGTPK